MNWTRSLLGLLVAALFAVTLLVGCGGGGGEITVKMTEYTFDPANVTVAASKEAKVTVVNQGTLTHTWVVPGLNVASGNVEPGQRKTVTFTPSSAGSYEIECDIPGHRDSGMKGTLTVK